MKRARKNRKKSFPVRLLSLLLIAVMILGIGLAQSVNAEDYGGQTEEVSAVFTEEIPQEEVTPAAEPEGAVPMQFDGQADGVNVHVDAPAGAFSAGTEMVVTPVYDQNVLNAAAGTVDDHVTTVQGVDVAFVENSTDMVNPALPVQVTMTSANIAQAENTVVIPVNGGGLCDAVAEENGAGNSVAFESSESSTYVIVGTESISVPFTAGDGRTYEVSVEFGENAGIPANARLEVSEVTAESTEYDYNSYVEQTATAIDTRVFDLDYIKLLDIKIVDENGAKVTPNGEVNVKIRLLDKAQAEETLQVVHFEGEEEKPVVMERSLEGDAVKFSTDGFSVYAVVDDGDATDHARMTVNFWNGSTKIATMHVKNSDTLQDLQTILYDPGVGTAPEGASFKGWIQDKSEYSISDLSDAKTINQIRQWAEGVLITEGMDEINFYAMFFKSYTATYLNENDVSLGTVDIPYTDTQTTVPYTVNMTYNPPDDTHNFEGWNVSDGGDHISGHTSGTVYKNGTQISVFGDVVFSVNAPEGHWLIFDENGKGGTYNAPQFIHSSDRTVQPSTSMARNGYTFGGWYDSKEHADAHGDNPDDETGKFVFGETLSAKTTVYASWIPNKTAPYTVLLWAQNTDRTAYELVGSYVNNNGTVGQNIPYTVVENGDEDYVTGVGNGNGHYTGFSIKDADKNKQVKITPEGDAVLELHYDRIEYNFKFYLYRDGTTRNRYDYANNSGNGSSLNNLVTWHTNQTAHPGVTADSGYTIQSETVDGRTYYYFVMQAYYGEDISSKWPAYDKITGANGREAVSYVMMVGTKLKPNPTNQGSGTVKGIITVLNENILGKTNDANGNYVVIRFPDNYYNWRYHIWFEAVEGETYPGKTLHTHSNGKTYYEETVLVVRSSNTTDANQNEPKYTGFDYVTRLGQNNSGTTWQGGHWTTNQGGTTLYHLNYIYDRQSFKIEYFDGNYVDGYNNTIQNRATQLLHESGSITQGAHISDSDKNYTPSLPEGEAGYIFEGWYLDEACTTPYTWSTMPVGGIKVYAKWRQKQYRVFLHPNAGTDTTLNWGSDTQEMNFRVAYDGTVSLPTGLRSEYELVGWYTDPSFSADSLFTSDIRLRDDDESSPLADYNKETDMTDPMDKWGKIGSNPSNSDVNRNWITKKLDLYAKWRAKLIGATGIHVEYDAGDGTNAPMDGTTYLDTSIASAQAASTPPEGKVFMYWVLQTWDETQQKYIDTTTSVQPGAGFEVLKAYARRTENPDHTAANPSYTYMVQLRAEYAEPGSKPQTYIHFYANTMDVDGNAIPNVTAAPDGNEPKDVTTYHDNISINEAVDVLPIDQVLGGSTLYNGYTFLGWAKTRDAKTPWLKLNTDGTYTVTQDGKTYSSVSQIAADESEPYEDLYAIWEIKTYEVTVKKSVTGNMSDPQKAFTINITSDKPVTYNDAPTQNIQLELKNEQHVTLTVTHGTKLTVKEDDYVTNDHYDAPVYKYNDNVVEMPCEITEEGEILVINNKDVIPDTGVNMDQLPFMLMLIAVIIGGVLLMIRRAKWIAR